MKILSAYQIKEWDKFTLEKQNITSWELMQRASGNLTDAIINDFSQEFFYANKNTKIHIFAGLGNNGGDALSIAYNLGLYQIQNIKVYIVWHSDRFSEDFTKALQRIEENNLEIIHLKDAINLPLDIKEKDIIIDGIFGTGLKEEVTNWVKDLLSYLNSLDNQKISIDVPSGLLIDKATQGHAIFKADKIYTLQSIKLAFLLPQNQEYTKNWQIIDIDLEPDFLENIENNAYFLQKQEVKKIIKKRKKFAHKGDFGHSLLIGGAYGKAGAVLMAGKACLRAGAGLLTIHAPTNAHIILQTALPEAMFWADAHDRKITQITPELSKYKAIGIGCGLGVTEKTKIWLKSMLAIIKIPLVLDADALNSISEFGENKWSFIPKNTILTPHPKEFERLVGFEIKNDFEKIEKLREIAQKIEGVIILKGANTAIALPSGDVFFNSTGTPALAKGGSGDVLTGIITALLSQNYSIEEASLLGVYWHGLAGEVAEKRLATPCVLASDVIRALPKAWREIELS
jgi:NAD(P)H-hydrate epimerase